MCASSSSNDNINLTDNSEENSAVNLVTNGVVRKYLNGAVYIESPADTLPIKEAVVSKTDNTVKRVSCSCSSGNSCKFHEKVIKIKNFKYASETQVIKKVNFSLDASTEDISNKSLTGSLDEEKEDTFKKWNLKKIEEKKKIEANKIKLQQNAEKEKQERLLQERENFKRWLANKRRNEIKQKLKKDKELKSEKDKEAEKERHKLECQLRYQLWLKQKEQEELEKKLEEQMAMIKISDERQRRIEENQLAYDSWLKSSAQKQKPVSAGKGLASLRSCVSVSYKNPVPWTPNVDNPTKPVSW